MIVTVNTDASHNSNHNVGGFACWIVCDAGRILRGGKIKGACHNPTEAETKAIANALAMVLASKWEGVKTIVVNSDCLPAMHLITRSGKNKSQGAMDAAKHCRDLEQQLRRKYKVKDEEKLIVWRHVKAHTRNEDARSYVNRWCDKEARKWCHQAVLDIYTRK